MSALQSIEDIERITEECAKQIQDQGQRLSGIKRPRLSESEVAPMAAPAPALPSVAAVQPVLYNVDAYTGLGILNSMINSKIGLFMKSITSDINSFISSLITINQNINQELDKKCKEIADLKVEIAALNEKNAKLEEWKKTMQALLKSDD